MFFASDNTSAVAPEILGALTDAQAGYVPSYGEDDLTAAVQARVREVFEAPEAEVFLAATGTAANALALASLCPPWGSVFCHELGHIQVDECNAPEFFTGGAKLIAMTGEDARITPAALTAALEASAPGDPHCPQPSVLSLTQATERGAAYTPGEVAALTAIAQGAGLSVHMDGSRFANALARQGVSPAEMSWRAGVDVLSLGATKNGAMAVEAVVLFKPGQAWEMELRRKRAGHLVSKMRFLSAQMLAYLEDGLWLRLAAGANAMTDRLAAGIAAVPGARVLNAIGANMIFAEITMDQRARLLDAGAVFKTYPEGRPPKGSGDDPVMIRLVTSFSTTAEEVDRFLEALGP